MISDLREGNKQTCIAGGGEGVWKRGHDELESSPKHGFERGGRKEEEKGNYKRGRGEDRTGSKGLELACSTSGLGAFGGKTR